METVGELHVIVDFPSRLLILGDDAVQLELIIGIGPAFSTHWWSIVVSNRRFYTHVPIIVGRTEDIWQITFGQFTAPLFTFVTVYHQNHEHNNRDEHVWCSLVVNGFDCRCNLKNWHSCDLRSLFCRYIQEGR